MRVGKPTPAGDPRPGLWPSEGVEVPAERPQVRGGLLLYYRSSAFWRRGAATDMEHVEAFERYSRFGIQALNTDEPFPRRVAELDFELVIVHYTVPAGDFYYLTDDQLRWLKSSRAYKVVLNQDEDRYCGHRFWFIDEVGFDLVDTMLEPSEYDKVYGSRTKASRIRTSLPGYVSEQTVAAGERLRTSDTERPIDIGYRGRRLPPVTGRASEEKYEIGRRFRELAGDSGLVLDIGLTEDTYLYGDDWPRFLARCRGMLGVESGVSVFDLDDRVMQQYEQLRERGVEPTWEDLTEAAAIEGNVFYRTISPRHFEAAALRCCQILFEGRYSGVLEPMVHYIPLRKDFANFDEVVRLFRDPGLRRELTENAHRDLIASGAYSYRRYIESFDEDLIAAGLNPDVSGPEVAVARQALAHGRRRRALRVQLRWMARSRLPAYLLSKVFKVTGFLRAKLPGPQKSTG
jgi:hypothetical protein